MSRFNTLYRGSATDAAEMLDGGDRTIQATPAELQIALINALQRIAKLEDRVADLASSTDSSSKAKE
jgi:hypothetical protein